MKHSLFKKVTSVSLLLALMVLGVVGSVSGAGTFQDPTSTGDSRATFVNSGPVKQIKAGGLHIGGASPVFSFSVAQPAEIIGGVFSSNQTNLAAFPQLTNPSAIIDGELCIGFGTGCTTPAATPATFNLYGSTTVTGDITIGNLAHGTATKQEVCADPSGYLVPCDGTEVAPETDDGLTQANGCFVAGTLVEMADGSLKKIEDIAGGEYVRGSTDKNQVKIKYEIDYEGPLYSINGSDYFVSSSHPFMTTEGWKSFDPKLTAIESPGLEVGLLAKGDVLVLDNGKTQKLEKFDSILAKQTVYNFGLEGSRDFYADGYLVHNVNLFPVAHAAIGGADGFPVTIETRYTKQDGHNTFVTEDTPNEPAAAACSVPASLQGAQIDCADFGVTGSSWQDPNDPASLWGCYYPEPVSAGGVCGCPSGSQLNSASSPNQVIDENGFCVDIGGPYHGPYQPLDLSCLLPDELEGQDFACTDLGLTIGYPVDIFNAHLWDSWDPWGNPDSLERCYYPTSTHVTNECACDGGPGDAPLDASDSTNYDFRTYGFCAQTR